MRLTTCGPSRNSLCGLRAFETISCMRIAMIHWAYPPVIGGVETHLSLLCPALIRMGHEVSILTGSHEGEPELSEDCGVRIRRVPLMNLNQLSEKDLSKISQEISNVISGFLDETKPDIIHTHNLHYFSEPHAHAVRSEGTRRGIPVINTAHNVWNDRLFIRLARSVKWDHVIAVSRFIKNALIGCGQPSEDITAIHHGIDGAPFFNARPEEAHVLYPVLRSRKVVFHPARMHCDKGSDIVIQAFRLVRQQIPDAFLVMAGTTDVVDWHNSQVEEIDYMRSLLEGFALQNDSLIDQYPIGRMPLMYAASSVVLYPSAFEEPFGLATIESMAAGKPIIVTPMGGMPEIIEPGVNGLIVPSRDPVALADATVQLLKDPKLSEQLAAKGREMFRERYGLDRMVHDTMSVYEKMLRGRKRRLS